MTNEARMSMAAVIAAATILACSGTTTIGTGGRDAGGGDGGGGGAACAQAPPTPVQPYNAATCEGGTTVTVATTGTGVTCQSVCADGAENLYGVDCDGTVCKCTYNDGVVCECPFQDLTCPTTCCPSPFPQGT